MANTQLVVWAVMLMAYNEDVQEGLFSSESAAEQWIRKQTVIPPRCYYTQPIVVDELLR